MRTLTKQYQIIDQIPYWAGIGMLWIFVLIPFGASSQSVSPDVADASSYKFSQSGIYVDMSFGEFAVSTIRSGDQIVTQGFLQPISIEQPCAAPQLVYYPNPVISSLTIEALDCDVRIEYAEVYDLFGKNVLEGVVVDNSLDLSELGVGVYIIRAYNSVQQVVGSLKIIKITA
jgi:hypothetical protein